MQKFPLRIKDNDLLVTELYRDPSGNRITALSVYLTQKASQFDILLRKSSDNYSFYHGIYAQLHTFCYTAR